MKVLVVGGTRFFGMHLVRSLLEKGHEVAVMTRGNVPDPFGERVERIHADRTQTESLQAALGGREFDGVCDNIAYCSNDVKALLDTVRCGRYVLTSSASVYADLHLLTPESGYDPMRHPLRWCNREDEPYDEIKRQAECALFQAYPHIQATAVRYPYVIGEDDYTERLYFYVEHILKELPMFVDNPDGRISFIQSGDAGEFLSWAVEQRFTGPINANSTGTLSPIEIIRYVEKVSGRKAVLSESGDPAPYNGDASFSLDTSRALALGYACSPLDAWVYGLLDVLVQRAASRC